MTTPSREIKVLSKFCIQLRERGWPSEALADVTSEELICRIWVAKLISVTALVLDFHVYKMRELV